MKPIPVHGGRRSARQITVEQAADEISRHLGRAIKSARVRRRLTQAGLGAKVGVSQSEVSRIELGYGRSVPLTTWISIARELGLRLRFDLARDWQEAPIDAGHLAIQELLLGLARATGCAGTFELPIRPNDPARSIDVFVRDDLRRRLLVEEAWNSFGDIGAGARSFDRKMAAARDFAVVIGGDRPYAVAGVWVVRATRRNRELVARYPEVFATKFPGSSARWVRTLKVGQPPPSEPGLVWTDSRTTDVHAWRRRRDR
ncbi:MAG TPA: helix-turn-helix transcriptional regulator [Patescibacteria group bacterium]|nr:helix-turn-helix transcriptional regulator [Patescibacteria group bacterium]